MAAIEETPADHESYRQLFTALVPPEALDELLETPGGIGNAVSSSGPHPANDAGSWDYEPRFWIFGSATAPELEPLVVEWRSGNSTVLVPDQGFLMTYGLVPRLADETVHWDDLGAPRHDVVSATPVSKYDFPGHTGASVKIARDFLEDYATIRNRALVQVYYVQRSGDATSELDAILAGQDIVDFKLPGRLIDLRRVEDGQVLVQVWGLRQLIMPGHAPISAGRWNYGTLEWPGLPRPLDHNDAVKLGPLDVVYVRDSVLDLYEGRPEYDIHPESGAVSYGSQWSVSWTRRVGRDIIAVELKKLYEGNVPETVRHWHDHAVTPPAGLAPDQPNVATRARRIVYAVTDLGEATAQVASNFTSTVAPSALDIVGIDRGELDYHGWWTADDVEPVTKHVPIDLTEDAFLSRCADLYKVVGEGLSESTLRQLLTALEVPPADIEGFRSLKLLAHLIRLADVAHQTGISLSNGKAVNDRLNETTTNRVERLFALNDLRQLADHDKKPNRLERLDKDLRAFGLNRASYVAGWGLALDSVYDGIAETLEIAANSLSRLAP
ncbi:MAG: hypothetical protein ABIU97_06065 [Dehalococcoidia bacterium]